MEQIENSILHNIRDVIATVQIVLAVRLVIQFHASTTSLGHFRNSGTTGFAKITVLQHFFFLQTIAWSCLQTNLLELSSITWMRGWHLYGAESHEDGAG